MNLPIAFCLLSGLLLTAMNELNGSLAKQTTPLFSSWIAHGVGSITAIIILFILYSFKSKQTILAQKYFLTNFRQNKSFLFFSLGGFLGAFTVIFSSITINSAIGLSGTLALMLLGQVSFGLCTDRFGIFAIPKKKFHKKDLLAISAILLGSWLIIFCR